MISDQPMVELVDPHRKACELYESGGLRRGFFDTMQTFDPNDKVLIQEAIRQLFTRGEDSYLSGADPVENFDRGVGDFVHLTGGKLLVADLAEQSCWQVKWLHSQFLSFGLFLGAYLPGVLIFVLAEALWWGCPLATHGACMLCCALLCVLVCAARHEYSVCMPGPVWIVVSNIIPEMVAQRIEEEAWTLSQEMAERGKFVDCLFVFEDRDA